MIGETGERDPKEEKEKEQEKESNEDEDEVIRKENDEEYYDWNVVPDSYPDDKKTGITFKGETQEYIDASKKIFNMFNKKGMKYTVNNRDIRIIDNIKSKPIKVEVKPIKGPSGKVNVTIFGVNKQGHVTMMINKVSGGAMTHVKAVALKVIKYLIDGLIDGEINDGDIEDMKCSEKSSKKSSLQCVFCRKILKTKQGLKIHITKQHKNRSKLRCLRCKSTFDNPSLLDKHTKICIIEKQKCELCVETFVKRSDLQMHMEKKHEVKNKYKCDVCEYSVKFEIEMKRHNRDKHDKTTCSTSPNQRNKRKMLKKKIWR